MTIHTISHIEYHCADAAQSAADLVTGFGFAPDARQPDRRPGVHAVHLHQGAIRLRLSSADAADHPVARFVEQHGDGVAVIALGCADPEASLERAVRHGGRVLDRDGGLVAGFGDVALRFVADVPAPAEAPRPEALLDLLDHAAICVPAGELAAAVRFCEAALGFHRIFGERVEIGAQAMDSSVVQSASGAVTFTLIEPDTDRQPGQIDAFLDAHQGPGVQHLAFRTHDIAAALRRFRADGVEFLTTPSAYYDGLAERLGGTAIPVPVLRELDVLVDQDHGGQLFQIFTRSVHSRRTFFLELIERQGAGTFGTANIKALYEAVERQNATASL
ncbi:4-hydroxyphenylpyruvate dioxygenase [Streptacidiphilus sp. N1-12]|uniref:4-hydroxyphenylpyruvate dioxygenase n=2 Tax=Streptacidiphilus alkalitolerans TaxID=3342712 RepID=A0ABV6VD16_9ACTN